MRISFDVVVDWVSSDGGTSETIVYELQMALKRLGFPVDYTIKFYNEYGLLKKVKG